MSHETTALMYVLKVFILEIVFDSSRQPEIIIRVRHKNFKRPSHDDLIRIHVQTTCHSNKFTICLNRNKPVVCTNISSTPELLRFWKKKNAIKINFSFYRSIVGIML